MASSIKADLDLFVFDFLSPCSLWQTLLLWPWCFVLYDIWYKTFFFQVIWPDHIKQHTKWFVFDFPSSFMPHISAYQCYMIFGGPSSWPKGPVQLLGQQAGPKMHSRAIMKSDLPTRIKVLAPCIASILKINVPLWLWTDFPWELNLTFRSCIVTCRSHSALVQ